MDAAAMVSRFYHRSFLLRNGVAITLRAIRPDDRERLRTAFTHLDAASIFTRFFSAKRCLTDAELTAATLVDFDSVVALVAVLESDPDTIIAGGRYARFPGVTSPEAEVAFTVEEDYQRLGLAGLILRELCSIAREAGVERFTAEVLPSNVAMLEVFRRSGLAMSRRLEDGVVHVSLELRGS